MEQEVRWLRQAGRKYNTARARLDDATRDRDRAVRMALGRGISQQRMAAELGVSRTRVQQLVRDLRARGDGTA